MIGKKTRLLLSSFLLMAVLPIHSSAQQHYKSGVSENEVLLRSNTSWNAEKIATDYPFIKLAENKLTYAGDSTALFPFYKKLYSLIATKKRKINVLHIGGSHVQAGMFTGKMRENLQSMSDSIHGQYGFFFPYKMAHTNSPAEIKTTYTGTWKSCRAARNGDSCQWGLAAMQTATTDSIAEAIIKVNRKDSSRYLFTSAIVYHNTSLSGYTIEPQNPEIDSFTTDSTNGFTQLFFSKAIDSLMLKFIKDTNNRAAKFELQGIQLLNNIEGLTYTAIGANGASLPTYLRCQLFEKNLATAIPDLVIFGIGINDANVPMAEFKAEEYKQNYLTLMRKIRSVNSNVQFIFITNNDSYFKRKHPNKNALKVREAMIEIGKQEHVVVWDFFSIMGGLNSIRKWETNKLARPDKIHFTREGYQLKADLLFDALTNDFKKFIASQKQQSIDSERMD
jgi:lysophospholipase L1-like esterase